MGSTLLCSTLLYSTLLYSTLLYSTLLIVCAEIHQKTSEKRRKNVGNRRKTSEIHQGTLDICHKRWKHAKNVLKLAKNVRKLAKNAENRRRRGFAAPATAPQNF